MSDTPTTATAPPSRWKVAYSQIVGGGFGISVLAIVLALLVGAIMICLTDERVLAASGYFFARPGDLLGAIGAAVGGAYSALFQGSILNFRVDTFNGMVKPITETLTFGAPLIAAGLGVALAFRVGLFNIGAQGQIILAAIFSAFVATRIDLPVVAHLVVAVAAGIFGGAIWGGLVGFLRARTGAHEVITTIMLNYVALYLLQFLLKTPVLQAEGSVNPISGRIDETATLPRLLGPSFSLNLGFLLAIAATVFCWWLFNRSALGFRFRALGQNPDAAKTAGIDVKNTLTWAMVLAGGLAGLAGVTQVLGGSLTSGFSVGIAGSIGFDAITVALLGRSRPWGVFVAGLLFGALKAGGYSMQTLEGVPVDIVLVVQSVIVLLIAAPPLVRAIFRLPVPRPSVAADTAKAVVSK